MREMKNRHLSFSEKWKYIKANFNMKFGFFFIIFPLLILMFQASDIGKAIPTYVLGNSITDGVIKETNRTPIQNCSNTGSSIHRHKSRCSDGSYIYIVNYEYSANGKTFNGRVYCDESYIEYKSMLDIHFSSLNPSLSYAKGCNITMLGILNYFMLLFLVVGMFIIGTGIKRVGKNIYLLERGKAVKGTITDMSPSGTQINNIPEFIIHFQYETDSGRTYTSAYKTLDPDDFEVGQSCIVLYNTNKPTKAILFEAIPESIRNKLRN